MAGTTAPLLEAMGEMPVTLGEYGPDPGEIEVGRTYAIDGIAGLETPCLSLAGIATAVAIGDPEIPLTVRADRVIYLDGALVRYDGFVDDKSCYAGCGTIPHHIFSPLGQGSKDSMGVPVRYYALDGMFALSEKQPENAEV